MTIYFIEFSILVEEFVLMLVWLCKVMPGLQV
jgi:hypothetical protein